MYGKIRVFVELHGIRTDFVEFLRNLSTECYIILHGILHGIYDYNSWIPGRSTYSPLYSGDPWDSHAPFF